MGEHHGYSNRFERASGDVAVSPARSLDAPAIRIIPGGRIAQPARLHLRTLAFLPTVSSRIDRRSAAGAPGAHESDNDGTLRRTGDRPRHSPGGGEGAHAGAYW